MVSDEKYTESGFPNPGFYINGWLSAGDKHLLEKNALSESC
jgi:hypothetical protein